MSSEVATKEFEDRVVLVTGGGGSCIGGPTALRFAQEGASVVICDLHERRNREMAERIRKDTGATVLAFHLDIADREKVDRMIAETERELGRVDVLVCNAAENKLGHMVEYDPADWDRTLDVSLSANFYLARKVLPGMVARKRGSIVNIASVAGWIGNPNEQEGEPAYSVAKAGLLALTRNIAHEVGPHGVRCNAVAPGLIWSRFVEKFESQFQPLLEKTPLRCFGQSEDVVEAILFLASDKRARFITGEALNVSGGWYMRP
ncbi:MAG: SDR family NAD(P)-dependent oxidoreductase [Solirubrobacteraceae bacterium]